MGSLTQVGALVDVLLRFLSFFAAEIFARWKPASAVYKWRTSGIRLLGYRRFMAVRQATPSQPPPMGEE